MLAPWLYLWRLQVVLTRSRWSKRHGRQQRQSACFSNCRTSWRKQWATWSWWTQTTSPKAKPPWRLSAPLAAVLTCGSPAEWECPETAGQWYPQQWRQHPHKCCVGISSLIDTPTTSTSLRRLFRSGELRTQKLKSHLLLKPGVGQYIAIHATLTDTDFFLAYF